MKCPTCGTDCVLDIEPFEYSYYYCPKCQKIVQKMRVC